MAQYDEIYTSFQKKKIQFHGKMLVRIFLPRSANFLFYGSAFLSTQFFRARISLSSHIRYSNDRKFIKLLIRIWGKSNELNFEKLHNMLFWQECICPIYSKIHSDIKSQINIKCGVIQLVSSVTSTPEMQKTAQKVFFQITS